jgi:hypothetical protein
MNRKGDPAGALVRNLHEALARVREDVEKVEFWADAVSGFTQPVPPYKAADVNIWVPPEQARRLADATEADSKRAKKRGRKRDDEQRSAGDEKPKA